MTEHKEKRKGKLVEQNERLTEHKEKRKRKLVEQN
jgi:hypothetical protein